MSITVVTAPSSKQLTLAATVKTELNVQITTDDALFDTLIDQISDIIETYLNRPLFRAQFQETLEAWGTDPYEMFLSRLPVVVLDEVQYDGSVQTLSDYIIVGKEIGEIYSAGGFVTSGIPNEWTFLYRAGYFLPGDDVSAATISAEASTSSYSDSAAGFPANLAAGDTFVVSGSGETTNNGTKTVVSATTSQIIVSETVVDEVVGQTYTMAFRNLPEGIERAAIEMVKQSYQTRKSDPTIRSLTVGPVRTDWAVGGSGSSNVPVHVMHPQLSKYRIHMRD